MARWVTYGLGGYRPERADRNVIAEGDQPDPPTEPPAGDWQAMRDRLNRSVLPTELKAVVGAIVDASERMDTWRRFPDKRAQPSRDQQ